LLLYRDSFFHKAHVSCPFHELEFRSLAPEPFKDAVLLGIVMLNLPEDSCILTFDTLTSTLM
jgi:hypothetical protein